jgi:2-oxoglutarate dehydrogenase E2 component (dihydrolipoamide succinyltransferase)
MKKIVIPKLGMATTEADIIKWKVKEGDIIKPGDAIVDIESEKVNMTIESEFSGLITKIFFNDGNTVAVGETICEVDESK